MKIGKVSQTVLKRSILKQLRYKRTECVTVPSMEEMCASVSTEGSSQTVLTDACLYGNEKELGVYAAARAVNDLASRGARPVGIGVRIHLPPYAYESRLKVMTEHLEAAAQSNDFQIFYVKAEINPVIAATMVNVSAAGLLNTGDSLIQTKNAVPGEDIVLVKPVGLEGTLRILAEKEAELSERFVKAFLNPIYSFREELFSLKEMDAAKKCNVTSMHQISDGGILAGLWDLTESTGVGMEAEMKEILIRQETIELCEHFRLNPYQLASAGSVLMTCKDGETLVRDMEKLGTRASVIGRTTEGNDRIIINGEERRFLDRPAPDELWKLYSETQQ